MESGCESGEREEKDVVGGWWRAGMYNLSMDGVRWIRERKGSMSII